MKRLSVKLKVTLWFTLIMTLIVAAVLALLFVIGERIVFEETQEKLINTVTESFNEIGYRFGKIDVDDDLDYYNEGVYVAVYDIAVSLSTAGSLRALTGRFPFQRTRS